MRSASAGEIAEALSITERGVRKRADKEGWKNIVRPVNGGDGKFYLVKYLPDDVRVVMARHGAYSVLVDATPAALAGAAAGNDLAQLQAEREEKARIAAEAQLAVFNQLAREKQDIAYARRDVIRAKDSYLAASNSTNVKQGVHQFCRLYNSGEIRITDHIRKHVEQVSWSSLSRWQAIFKESGLPGLAPAYHNPKKGASQLTEEHKKFLTGMIHEHPHAKFTTMLESLESRFVDLPGMSAIRRFVNTWKAENASLLLLITNPDKWRNKKQFALGDASEQVTRLNQVWEFDSTPADVILADGRYCLIGVVDVYSRRFKLHVTKTSRATAVAALTRRALLDWGKPEIAKTDNGSDYVSRHMVQVFEALQIEQILCPPFTPEAKPHIERAFKTFAHSFQETMPGYIGHSVADRKDIEARKSFASRIMEKGSTVEITMTAEELQKYCDRWCAAIYHQNRHRSLNNRTPAEVARAWQETVRVVSNERALDILLAEAPSGGVRTVAKTGVSIDNITYISDVLPDVGTTVRVKIDTIDLGTIYLFDADTGAFLCVAQDPMRTGIDRAETAAKARHYQKSLIKAGQRELKQNAKEQALDMIHEEILAHRESKIANIIELPVKKESYTTPALDEAAKAAKAMDKTVKDKVSLDDLILDLGNEALSQVKPVKHEKIVLLRSDADQYDLIRTQTKATKRKLTKSEFDFLTEYYQTASGRTYMALEGDMRVKIGMEEKGQAQA
jgi:transposase InsO family protein